LDLLHLLPHSPIIVGRDVYIYIKKLKTLPNSKTENTKRRWAAVLAVVEPGTFGQQWERHHH
jgi:hypothetical protein